MFQHELLKPVRLDRQDRPTGRVYVNDSGKEYRSVTSVLSKINKDGIDKWRKRVGEEEANKVSNRAKWRGTELHAIAEKFLLNEQDYAQGAKSIIRGDFAKIRPYLQEHVTRVYGIELMMYSDVLKAAGTSDLICEWKGRPAIVDFKTSRRVKTVKMIGSYFVQATAYAMMVEELYGIHVPSIAILMVVDDSEPLIFEKETEPFYNVTKKIFR